MIIVTGSIAAKRVIELCQLVDKKRYQIVFEIPLRE